MSGAKFKLDNIYSVLKNSYSSTPFLLSLIAGGMASVGLATNSISSVIASTLISPMSTFIVQANLLWFLKKHNYNLKNFKYGPWYIPLLLIVITTFIISYLSGKLFTNFKNPLTNEPFDQNWPSAEMLYVANPSTAVYFIPIALLSGLIFPLLAVNRNLTGLIGVGIACSIIPPLANIGLSLNFNYDPEVHPPELENYKKTAVYTGVAIFLVNVLLLLLPSRLLMPIILNNNNIFENIEGFFNF